MLDWLKNINKDYPEFWKRYLAKFEKKPERFVVMRTHASGTNPDKDVIFSFGAVSVIHDQIVVGDSFEAMIYQYKYLHDNGLPNTFIVESALPKMQEPQAIEDFVSFIGNAILVGYHIRHDVDLINEALSRLDAGRLKNEALDLEIMHRKWKDIDKHVTFDVLLNDYKLPRGESWTASEEAYNMALVFLTLKSKLGIK